MKVIGIGDNVVDNYMHIRTLFPGGNALNFSVYASMLPIWVFSGAMKAQDMCNKHSRIYT